jgi:hypothetical protein
MTTKNRLCEIRSSFKTIIIEYADRENNKHTHTFTDYVIDYATFILENIDSILVDDNKIISYSVHNATFNEIMKFVVADIVENDSIIKNLFIDIMSMTDND